MYICIVEQINLTFMAKYLVTFSIGVIVEKDDINAKNFNELTDEQFNDIVDTAIELAEPITFANLDDNGIYFMED